MPSGIEVARQLLQVGEPAQRPGLAVNTFYQDTKLTHTSQNQGLYSLPYSAKPLQAMWQTRLQFFGQTQSATASPTVAASPPTFAKFNDTTSYRLFRY
ncbi:hypothetical protein GNE08_14185 [Trichormus variabilis ARAD]|uniref:Uncharacterized protein n=1 Tax=Trichormus variabilis N2B TaxID=2681315 RepID=A0ABR6S9F9_ANAVA|nr:MULTISPECIES: hypothetical protein [Nostocaceae]MBC1215367.1 hypothetical protein [Trichormus variabilis ARAD]MBC1254243.1 hypothetical protein [Trichormus variabilis V5]MBC1268360.1 hypothetical protein [Trichormus variabilis FSR]MBC1302846.1 hypothetical protein [Trichormus variabilis N2B]MBC1310724.1 hypothetical protein [Trichormus variabilis PNB]